MGCVVCVQVASWEPILVAAAAGGCDFSFLGGWVGVHAFFFKCVCCTLCGFGIVLCGAVCIFVLNSFFFKVDVLSEEVAVSGGVFGYFGEAPSCVAC